LRGIGDGEMGDWDKGTRGDGDKGMGIEIDEIDGIDTEFFMLQANRITFESRRLC